MAKFTPSAQIHPVWRYMQSSSTENKFRPHSNIQIWRNMMQPGFLVCNLSLTLHNFAWPHGVGLNDLELNWEKFRFYINSDELK